MEADIKSLCTINSTQNIKIQFIIWVEVLSNMIRLNKDIKGIKLNEKEILVWQFADDTILALDVSDKSFTESILLLDKFSMISGFKDD